MLIEKYHKKVEEILGNFWLEEGAEIFLKKRKQYNDKNIYNPNIPNLEKNTHPLVRDILTNVKLEETRIDLNKLPTVCKAALEINLLGRDLFILGPEIVRNKNIFLDYQKGLADINSYDQRRFELFIAANFKLMGFDLEFIPRSLTPGIKTHEFTVKYGDRFYLNVECKQRFQRATDLDREKFLYLLTANIFPRLFSLGVRKVVIELKWHGNVKFGEVKKLSDIIVAKAIGLMRESRFQFMNYEISLKTYSSIPTGLVQLQKPHPNYTTSIDSYLAVHNGIFLSLNRDVGVTTIKNMRALYHVAKSQIGGDARNKAIYLDIGTLPLDAIEEFSKSLMRRPPTGMALLVVLKHQLHINDKRQITFTPNSQIVWNRKLLPNSAALSRVPGFDGGSGFDKYIKEFV